MREEKCCSRWVGPPTTRMGNRVKSSSSTRLRNGIEIFGSPLALRLRSPGLEDCLCGPENPRCGLIGNFLLAMQPMLNVAACGFCAGQPKRLATYESDGFRFYFPDVPVHIF